MKNKNLLMAFLDAGLYNNGYFNFDEALLKFSGDKMTDRRLFFGCRKCGFMFYVERIMGASDAELPDLKCPRCKATTVETPTTDEILAYEKPITQQELHAVRETELIPKPKWWERIFYMVR